MREGGRREGGRGEGGGREGGGREGGRDSPIGIMIGERESLCLAAGMSMEKASTPPWLVPTTTPCIGEWPGKRSQNKIHT